MNIFSRLIAFIRQVMNRMIPAQSVEQVEHIETPLSTEMQNALELWHDMYTDKAPWLKNDHVHSAGYPVLICAEMARQIVTEMKWHISAKAHVEGEEESTNPRSEYLKEEFAKLMDALQEKLEQGLAAGGMTIRPYPKDGRIFFGWTMDWELYPIAFDDVGNLRDVIFQDQYRDGNTTYTRLERHKVVKGGVEITQRAFKSGMDDYIGTEIELKDVPQWSGLAPRAKVANSDGPMFGWFKVATANNCDTDSPMGVSVFHKARKVIEQADYQYSRLLWEYEGSELAVDVDPLALKPKKGEDGKLEMPKLNDRLFRAVDVGEDGYRVFSPNIRDASLLTGLNKLEAMIEDLVGLSRGTLSDAPAEARTATELKILRQRTYTTVRNNQAALERCLRDVVRVMDIYASTYNLAPEGEYEVSFEWDDSVLTDTQQELGERLELLSQGIMSKAEIRQWYTGETRVQAEQAIKTIEQTTMQTNMDSLLMQAQIESQKAAEMAALEAQNAPSAAPKESGE